MHFILLVFIVNVACATTHLRGLTNTYTVFTKIGDGFCRTTDNKTGNYDKLCSKDRNPCNFDKCQYYCEVIDKCVAFEHNNYTCEIHYKEMPNYKQDHEAKCYKKEKKRCGFHRIGGGHCRDQHNTVGAFYHKCDAVLGQCSRDECKDYCRQDSNCIGIEYNKNEGKCEIHTGDLSHVNEEDGVSCYEYLGPCN